MFTLLKHKNINFFLKNSCKKWFCLPEKDVFDFIDTLTEKNILFDLGACEGRFTIYAQKKNIKTYSFEPDKYNFNVLLSNINKNNLNNKTIYKIAISDENKNYFNKGQPERRSFKNFENGDRLNTFLGKRKSRML